MEVTGRQGRRRQQLLDGIEERRGRRELIEDALHRSLCGELALEMAMNMT
jgi:hypothetical protein